jgi:hypothetical protein
MLDNDLNAARRPANRAPDWFDLVTALFTVLVIGFQLVRPAPAELMQADSQSYLSFSAVCTAGYPLFLRFVEHLPGGLLGLPWLQLGFYGVTAWLLASSFRRVSDSNFGGGLLLVLLLGNGQVTRLSFMIMTESLFLSCLMLLLALFCRLVQPPRWPALVLASLVAGSAVLIRPAGYALLVSLPVVSWWSWRGALPLMQAVFAAMVPGLVVLGLGMVAYHAQHDLWRTQSFLGRNLFGKAGAVVDVTRESADPTIRWIAAAVAPERAEIEQAPTAFDRFRLLVPYYDVWRWRTLYAALPAQTGTPRDDPAALDDAMFWLSLDVIASAPIAYLGDVALNYAALWWLPDAMTHRQLANFRAFVASLGPLPDLIGYPAWHREHSDVGIWMLHGFMMAALVSSVWWAWRLAASAVTRTPVSSLARLGFVTGLVVQASFLLTASLQAGSPRYVWAMWPAISILFVSGVLACSEALRRARSTSASCRTS